jgi:hypothetical protein
MKRGLAVLGTVVSLALVFVAAVYLSLITIKLCHLPGILRVIGGNGVPDLLVEPFAGLLCVGVAAP